MEIMETITNAELLQSLQKGAWSDGETAIIISTSNRALAKQAEELAQKQGIGANLLALVYDDLDYDADLSMPATGNPFNPHLARAVWSFIADHMGQTPYFLATCDGSVSRSAAIRAFAIRMNGGDDLEAWTGLRYRPNVLVYRLLLQAAGIPTDDGLAAKRLKLKELLLDCKTAGRAPIGMHLADGPFEAIAAGSKDVELRRWDEKRSGMLPGNLLVFARLGNPDDIILARAGSLHVFESFADMFRQEPAFVARAGFDNAEEALAGIAALYGDDAGPALAIYLTVVPS